ncbi:plasminogen, isoform CRA_c [Mus musculus]|nr:plasminogen, isoform CRA_c [Mus musculus]
MDHKEVILLFLLLRETSGGTEEMPWEGGGWLRGQPSLLALANQP